MGELLDRSFQRELLNDLQDLYPQSADIGRSYGKQDTNRLLVNLAYLDEQGLISFIWNETSSGPMMHSAKITARGIDFLADDGGLSAILGVVTVKLHDDTIRELLVRAVDEAKEDPSVKARLVAQIKALPAEGLKEATMAMVKAGLAATPSAIMALQASFNA